MKTRSRPGVVLALVIFCAGCGGTWENDSENWKRAFGSSPPQDVTVLHSKYWRSAHWSFEFQYFFEIAPNAKLKEQLIAGGKLRRGTGDDAGRVKKDIVGDVPAWFAPGDAGAYEVWVATAVGANVVMLLDRKSETIFLTDYLV